MAALAVPEAKVAAAARTRCDKDAARRDAGGGGRREVNTREARAAAGLSHRGGTRHCKDAKDAKDAAFSPPRDNSKKRKTPTKAGGRRMPSAINDSARVRCWCRNRTIKKWSVKIESSKRQHETRIPPDPTRKTRMEGPNCHRALRTNL